MAQNIIKRDVTHDISQSYLDYAMDVIIGRALPDIRDGFKPVHRRILYSMWDTGNVYSRPHKKSARTVGEVLGKYHPHGDSSVYDAMVRLAQPFSLRYPFVDGHGNFGSVDGDGAAAMRYTEARMSKIAECMMEDIDKDTVDMNKNYDETLDEPSVLPSKLPNLLINGTEGIAVGYASKMPPHNLTEAMEGIIAKIDDPSLDSVGLMKYIKAPDFPLGGIIMGIKGVHDMYTTGQGTITVRSTYEMETLKNGKVQIVFTTVPYQVNKSELVKNIDHLAKEKIIPDIAEVRDESSVNDGIRIVVELKKSANPAKIVSKLFKKTKLQDNFAANMNALVPNKNGKLIPKMVTLDDIVTCFIKHREDVVTRKYKYLLDKAEAREHILEGLIKAISIIDKVVATIRASRSVDDAKSALVSKFGFSERQAIAILDYKLQRLSGLEIEKVKKEKEEVEANIKKYTKILASKDGILSEIKKDCKEVMNTFGDDRRTQIMYDVEKEADDDEDSIAEIENKDVVITITNTGYIKSVPLDSYQTQSKGGKGVKTINKKDIDVITQMITTNKRNILLCLGSDGRMYKLPVTDINETDRTARGQYINTLIEANADVQIVSILDVKRAKDPEGSILMFSHFGGIKKIEVKDLITSRRSVMAIKLNNEDDSVVNACYAQDGGHAFIATHDGKIICFGYDNVRSKGRVAGTVRGIRLEDGDYVVNADIMDMNGSLLTVTNTGVGKKTKCSEYTIQNIGGKGTVNYKPKTGVFVASVINVNDDEDVLIACNNGKLIRTPSKDISNKGRTARGGCIVKLEGNEEVTVVNAVPSTDSIEK